MCFNRHVELWPTQRRYVRANITGPLHTSTIVPTTVVVYPGSEFQWCQATSPALYRKKAL